MSHMFRVFFAMAARVVAARARWALTLTLLLPLPAMAAYATFANMTMTTPNGTTVSSGGTANVVAAYNISAYPATGYAITLVQLLESNGSGGSVVRAQQAYTGRPSGKDQGDGYLNDARNGSFTVAFPAGSHVLWIRATRDDGLYSDYTQSTIVINTNAPPAVSLTAPSSGSVVQTSASTGQVSITGTATQSYPSVDHTDVLVDGSTSQTLTGSAATAINLSLSLAAGSHTIALRATNTLGLAATTAANTVFVNRPPTVTMSAPTASSQMWAGSPVVITVTGSASDPDSGDSVASTAVVVNGSTVSTLTGSAATSISTSYTASAAGSYQFQLLSTDTHGATTLTPAVTVTLAPPPAVSLSSPANSSIVQIAAAATTGQVTVTGSASESSPAVDHTDVLVDGSSVQTLTGAAATSVSVSLSLSPGAHSIALRATNTLGYAATTSAVSVFVNRPPTVTMTAPTAGNQLWSGSAISATITGSASDPDSGDGVSNTQLLVNGTSVSTLMGAAATSVNTTYSMTAAGTYQFQLQTTDNHGGVTTTSPVSITLAAAPTVSLTAPTAGAVVQIASNASAGSMTFTGTATESSPAVDHTDVMVDGSSVQTLTGAAATSVSVSLSLSPGAHSIALRATNTLGYAATTSAVSVFVNRPPAVTMTAPTAGNQLWSGSAISVTITGSASDPDSGDGVSNTQLLVNGTSVSTLMGAAATSVNTTYSMTAAGTYQFQLQTTDNHGGVTTTSPVSITLAAAPTVSLTAPTAGAVVQIASNASSGSMTVTGTVAESSPAVDHTDVMVDGSSVQTLTGAAATSVSVSLSLSPGAHSIALRATNTLGYAATTSAVSVFVNRPPTVTMTAPTAGNQLWSGSAISATITGSASDPDSGDGVSNTHLLVNGSSVSTLTGAAATSVNTTYSMTAAGTYQFQLQTTDNHGGVTTTSPVSITLAAAPTVSLTAPTAGAVVQIASNASAGSMTFTGTATESSPAVDHTDVMVDGSSVQTLTGAAATSVSVSLSLSPGAHSIALRATNTLGYAATTSAVSVFVNRPPAVTMTAPTAGNQLWSGSAISVTITGSASDPDSGDGVSNTQLLVNGTSVSTLMGAAATSVNTTYSMTAAGTYQFQLQTTDNHGGVTTTSPVSITLAAAPTVSLTAPTAGAVVQIASNASSGSMTVTGTVAESSPAVDHTDVLVDGSSVQTLTGAAATNVSTSVTLTPGAHTIALRGTNALGLAATTTAASVFVNRPPTVTMSAPAARAQGWNGSSVAIAVTGSASDPDSGDTISKTELLVNGSSVSTLTGSAATNVSTSYTATASGTYQFQLRATDGHGGVTVTPQVTVVLDASPTVTLSSPSNGAAVTGDPNGSVTATVTGSATPMYGTIASLQVLVDGQASTTVNAATISAAVPVTIGQHTLQLRAVDSTGQTGTSGTVTINVAGSLAQLSQPAVVTGPKAGTIKGEYAVNSGKASYHVDIAMPPGVNSMVPSVALSYEGGVDIGSMGVGWSLIAGSLIERCPPTIVQDGRVDTVQLGTSDRLCLDGKRLQLVTALPSGCNVSSATWPGCYDTAYWSPTAEYRTEVESYTRVRSSGSGFVVYTKDRRIHYYGDQADTTDTDSGATATQVFSSQRTAQTTGSNPTTVTHTWARREVVDRFGNAIDYTYVKDTTSGEFFMRYIRYGGNANAGQAHFAKVQFDYATRPDADSYYIAGARADRTQRLTAITTFTDTNSDGSGGSQTHQYTIGYEQSPSSGRSRVTSLKMCGATASDCLPATVLRYGNPNSTGTLGFTSRGTWTGPVLEDAVGVGTCATAGPSNFGDCNYAVSDMFIAADFNGDGVTDLMTRYPRLDGTLPITIYINNGNGFTAQPVQFNGVTVDSTYYVVQTGDFDGDGQTDLLIAQSPKTSGMLTSAGPLALTNWKICYSRMRQGNGFQCQEWAEAGQLDASGNSQSALSTVYDFDGDGRDDVYFSGATTTTSGGLVIQNSGTQRLCTSTGTGFSCKVMSQQVVDLGNGRENGGAITTPQPTNRATTDFDGDGRTDLVSFSQAYKECTKEGTNSVCPSTFAYTGTGAIAQSYTAEGYVKAATLFSFQNTPEYAAAAASTQAMFGGGTVGDLNGDGYSDFIAYYQGSPSQPFVTQLCQGMGLFAAATCSTVTFPTSSNIPRSQFVGDYGGDGTSKIFGQLFTGTGAAACTLRNPAGVASGACGGVWTLPPTSGGPFANNVESSHTDWLDLTGNGLSDIIGYTVGGHWQVWTPNLELGGSSSTTNTGEAIDRLVQVTDGMGKQVLFTYALPGDSSVYSPDAIDVNGNAISVTYPEHRMPRMGTLVSKMQVDNGQGGWTTSTYAYAGATRDMQGRGNLGFARVDVTDADRHITRTEWFSKAWPNIGTVVASQEVDASGVMSVTSSTLASQVVALDNNGNANGQATWTARGVSTVCGYVSGSTTSNYDNGPVNTVVTAVNSLDAWCNPTSQASTISGDGSSYPTSTAVTFNYDVANWFMAQPSQTTVTKTRGGASVTRTSQATFDPTSGEPVSTTVQPNDPLLKLVTTVYRTNTDGSANAFGLVSQTQQAWQDPISSQPVPLRTISKVTAWDSRNRFALTVQNALGQSVSNTYDDRYGSLTSHTDLNGLVTTMSTDAFGQETVVDDPEGNEHRHFVRQCGSSCPSTINSFASLTSTAVVATIDEVLHNNGGGSFALIAAPTLTYADDAGRALRAQTWGFDGRLIYTDLAYDALGRRQQAYHPRYSADPSIVQNLLEYDDRDRVIRSTVYGESADARVTSNAFAGRQTTITNPKNYTNIRVVDATGLLATAIDANAQSTSYQHEPFGGLSQVTDSLGNVVSMTYDTLGAARNSGIRTSAW